MSIPEESSTQQPTDAAAHLPSQQRRSSYLSSGGDWTDDTPVAVEPPSGTSTTSTNIGMTSSLPPPLAVTVPIEFEGMDVDIPLNDLSDDAADEAAGFAPQSSVGSLLLDDHLAAVASAAAKHVANDEEVSTTSAGSATRGRRPSFQTHRRPSQRRRSSATSFEMHDSLIFEELNKLVEDDTCTDSDGEDDDDGDPKDDQDGKKVPASISSTSTMDEAAANQEELALKDVFANNNNNNNNNSHRAGRRGSSRSLASVIEDMELDEDDINDIDNNDDGNKARKKMPVVMQFEQRILDRLERQDDKRALVRTRSEAFLLSGRSAGGSRRGSGSRLGRLSDSSSPSRNYDPQYTIQQGNHALRGSRAVQSERVLTDRAREVWPEIQMEAPKNATSTKGDNEEGNDGKKDASGSGGKKTAASNKFSIKSWFRGLGRKNN